MRASSAADPRASPDSEDRAPPARPARTTSDKPIPGRRDVSAAQNVRHQAPLFVALDGLELIQLRRFPGWVRWLFLELCAACDFETGELATSYAKLQALLECSQPRQGGPRLPVPSVPQIRRALDDLEAANMLGRDKAYNIKADGGRGILFLSVGPRKNFGTAKANRDRSCDRVPKTRKPRRHAGSKASAGEVAAGVAAGDSGAEIPYPPTPVDAELSTDLPGAGRRGSASSGPVAVGAALAQGLGPPQGAESRTPKGVPAPLTADYDRRSKEARIRGRTAEARPLMASPGPTQPTIVAQAMRARMRKSAPPGGQDDAPQAGDDSPPSARIRRPRKPVLKGEVCEGSAGESAPGAGAEGLG